MRGLSFGCLGLRTERKIQKRDCCVGLSSKTEPPPTEGINEETVSAWLSRSRHR